MASLLAAPAPGTAVWTVRHDNAVLQASAVKRLDQEFEAPIVRGLEAWAQYARDHKRRYGISIGEAAVMRVGWIEWGRGLYVLLNGFVGHRLNCVTLETFILDTAREYGCGADFQ